MTSRPVRALEVRELHIPFKTSFRHASADRAETSTIWVDASGDTGNVGHGESCPRPYVTGETLESAASFVAGRKADLLRSVVGLDSMRAWTRQHHESIDRNPAAWCAVELALIDLFAKDRGLTVDALLGVPPPRGPFTFSAVIGDASPEAFAATANQYRRLGFCDFKIKLSGDPSRDRAKLAEMRRWDVPRLRVRADANNLWTDAADAIAFLQSLDFPLYAVEEPIGANEYAALARIADVLQCRIVLDESFLRAEQLVSLPGRSDRWVINVRVSKMGGLLRSLDVVSHARAAGCGIVVGAQVGESSLLTRAALTVAQAAGPDLIAQEGAFGTHLLQWDVCDPPVMFGSRGVLDPAAFGFLDAPGFGLVIDTSRGASAG